MKIQWIVIGSLVAVTAWAQMDMNMSNKSPGSKFMQDMNVDMERMDHDMASAPMTGDVDHDFVVMMIPHHQGAIDMAEVGNRCDESLAKKTRRENSEIIA